MSKRAAKRARQTRDIRRAAFDKLSPVQQAGRKRPGSTNRKKQS